MALKAWRSLWNACFLPVVFSGALLTAQPLDVENGFGGIRVRSVMGLEEPEIRASSPSRPSRPEDVVHVRNASTHVVRCVPADGAVIDLEIAVPHSAVIRARTGAGSIVVSGLIREANLTTGTGDVLVEGPLSYVRIRALADTKPASVETPAVKGVEYLKSKRNGLWALADVDKTVLYSRKTGEHPIDRFWDTRRVGSYGYVQIRATSPKSIRLADSPLPSSSWIKPTASAKAALEVMRGSRTRSAVAPTLPHQPGVKGDGDLVFSADVRLVTMHVPVYDTDGRPVPGLTSRDFHLEEDGKPQRMAFAVSEELPFDLILLLDLSDSTLHRREEMIRAARGFAALARPADRVAIYVFAEKLFHVISPLTSDRARLNRLIDSIPQVVGDPTTALYDAMALSYFQEEIHRSGRRSALVILSDGLDNSLAPYASQGGSIIGFRELKAAVSEWPVLLYAILLPARGSVAPDQGAAGRRMSELAEATGGRVFPASSIRELGGVYERVAAELRSIYTLGYYPSNQDFNGKWRKITLRVLSSGRAARAKPGYYAR